MARMTFAVAGLTFQKTLEHPEGFLVQRDPTNHQIMAPRVVRYASARAASANTA